MALRKTRSELPKDAIELTEEEALKYQYTFFKNWKPQTDVWPITYGPGILGALTGLNSIYIQNYFRKKLLLHNYGRLTSYIPIVIFPTAFTIIFHETLVTNSILLSKVKPSCMVCIETRSAVIQTTLSNVYPLLLAPVASFFFATNYFTHYVPPISEVKNLLTFTYNLSKPLVPKLPYIVMAQMIIAVFITYLESQSVLKVYKKLENNDYDRELM